MAKISLLKRITGSWEQRREDLLHDLQKIQVAINGIPDPPIYLAPRSISVLSSPTPLINVDEIDQYNLTLLTEAVASFSINLQGTPVDGQQLIIRVLDNGTPRVLSWGSRFASRGATLPTLTTASKYHYITLRYNAITSTFDCTSATVEA